MDSFLNIDVDYKELNNKRYNTFCLLRFFICRSLESDYELFNQFKDIILQETEASNMDIHPYNSFILTFKKNTIKKINKEYSVDFLDNNTISLMLTKAYKIFLTNNLSFFINAIKRTTMFKDDIRYDIITLLNDINKDRESVNMLIGNINILSKKGIFDKETNVIFSL